VSVRYEWADNEQIILYIYVEAPWTWAEYLEMARAIKTIIDGLDHPCATIVDATRYESLPKDKNAIQILMGMDKLISENVFASALVGAPYGVVVFIKMLMRLRPRMQAITFFAATIDEARKKSLSRYQHMQIDNP
jgi:hypothetical protein